MLLLEDYGRQLAIALPHWQREINAGHVDRLAEIMRQHGYNHGRPISIVRQTERVEAHGQVYPEGSYWICDGIHRLCASRKAEVIPSYVIVDGNAADSDQWRHLGTAQRNWSMRDEIESYASEGVPGYIWARSILNKYEWATPSIVWELSKHVINGHRPQSRGRVSRPSHHPTWDPSPEWKNGAEHALLEAKRFCDAAGIASNSRTLVAVLEMMHLDGFKMSRLMRCAELYPGDFKIYRRRRDTLKAWTDIYNLKLSRKNRIKV